MLKATGILIWIYTNPFQCLLPPSRHCDALRPVFANGSNEIVQNIYRSVREDGTIELDDLPLRGDVLVKCFQRTCTAERAPFFRCQFNTCTFELSSNDEKTYILRFYREELDDIFDGK